MSELVLSIFPGGGLLDHAFAEEGFTVVRGPDPLWGGDIRTFHPPAGKFDGIIGGDPCQSHSALANLVRAKGLEPSFPDMTPEYQRVVEEARPAWFLRENVPQAPDIKPAGYDVRSFKLDLSALGPTNGDGQEQMRTRRWWFGVREGECPELRQWIEFALFQLPATTQAVAVVGQSRGQTKWNDPTYRKRVTAVGGHDVTADALGDKVYRAARAARQPPVTGRHEGAVGSPDKDYSPPHRSLEEMLRLQGLPPDWLKHQPWTMQAKRKIVGNGVPLVMGRALARAILSWQA